MLGGFTLLLKGGFLMGFDGCNAVSQAARLPYDSRWKMGNTV